MILQARVLGLFHAITDCGAGGVSSAVGEMGAFLGEVDEQPRSYGGLSYTEICISEAQERMVLAVPPEKWPAFSELCASESVEATVLGRFVDSGRLTLSYHGEQVGDLSMDILHEGRPSVVREASWTPPEESALEEPAPADYTADLTALLSHWDVCSKEWIIRQYDHEVQGRTAVRPLVGSSDDGPGDASVIVPVRGSFRGLAVACGLNSRFGKLDPYAMAGCVIDEAIRNCVAVGADPERIALLDNFCWGNTERPETLGSLVLAAQACHDVALSYGTPFISGKDSLNNEYAQEGTTLAIPPTLLISAIGQVSDVRSCITMDLKEPGNVLMLLGETRNELGGSLWSHVHARDGGRAFREIDPESGRRIFAALAAAIKRGLLRSCHDLSEGGLAVALAEMAFAGGLGATVALADVPRAADASSDFVLLFSESPTRFVVELRSECAGELAALWNGLPVCRLGEVTGRTIKHEVASPGLTVHGLSGSIAINAEITRLKAAWQEPLRW